MSDRTFDDCVRDWREDHRQASMVAISTRRLTLWLAVIAMLTWFGTLRFLSPGFVTYLSCAMIGVAWGWTWWHSRKSNFAERSRLIGEQEFWQPLLDPGNFWCIVATIASEIFWILCVSFNAVGWEAVTMSALVSLMTVSAIWANRITVHTLLPGDKRMKATLRASKVANYNTNRFLALMSMMWVPSLYWLAYEPRRYIGLVCLGAISAFGYAALENYRDGGRIAQMHFGTSELEKLVARMQPLPHMGRSIWATYIGLVSSAVLFLLCWFYDTASWEIVLITFVAQFVCVAGIFGARLGVARAVRAEMQLDVSAERAGLPA